MKNNPVPTNIKIIDDKNLPTQALVRFLQDQQDNIKELQRRVEELQRRIEELEEVVENG